MNKIRRPVSSKSRKALIGIGKIAMRPRKGTQGGSERTAGRRLRGGAVAPMASANPMLRLSRNLVVAGLVGSLTLAQALPQNGQVSSGTATVVQGSGLTTITQTSQNASLNWSSFNVAQGERVVFAQPNANAIALNRIADTRASQILGSLRANGQVFLVNPNGIVFGAGAQVNVGALVASTLAVGDSALALASKSFSGAATGRITNLGTIRADQGGYVALIGHQVSNQGSLQAAGGSVALAAGAQITLQFADHQLLGLTVDRNTLGNLADNHQLIQADGGQVFMDAGARDSVLAGVVNNSGRVQARTVQDVAGVITLGGGQLLQLGTLDVSAPVSGHAGSVRVDAAAVLDSGQIDASSAAGQGGQVALRAVGGLIQTASARVNVDGATQGGHIALQAHNVFSSATLSANGSGAGAHGGTIDVLATQQVALQGARLDASGTGSVPATNTGGLIRIGGDFQGANPGVINATTTLVNGTSTLRTDGGRAQGGGKVVIWSDARTAYFGAIQARGGAVEVSSRDVLQFAGDVKARQLLLDPKNITILSGATAVSAVYALVDPNPSAGRNFGQSLTVLGTSTGGVFTPNDRVAIAVASDNSSRGAVYLFNTATGVLLSTLTGTQSNDKVGSRGVTALTNGHFVVGSSNWANGSAVNAGAVTWGSSTLGVSGSVSASNSLVGSQTGDQVGGPNAKAITALTNGNYVVASSSWANGAASNAGAVTWGSGTAGVSGPVSASNSLVGSQLNDRVGLGGITGLTNGNYVVSSGQWANGSFANAGAVTWGNGMAGVSGAVNASNSLVGSRAGDAAGSSVTALTQGNYVVGSVSWANAGAGTAGAATWGSGTAGISGVVSASNSLVGSRTGDSVGSTITALTNGSYVVASPTWANGSVVNAGAATWGSGTAGVSGAVSASNSLVGSLTNDKVSLGGITALTYGNYVVGSENWANGSAASAGAATWGSGTAGVIGAVSASNSLVGSAAFENVSSRGITALTNGNYVVSSPFWGKGATGWGKGAATWGSGTTGVSGVISVNNSLVGAPHGDMVSSDGITALTNGNYVVGSQHWYSGSGSGSAGGSRAGAATWGSGTTGISGVVSASNSLVGSQGRDSVGYYPSITALANGNYVVGSDAWNNGSATRAGAVTWGSGTAGVSGAVSITNSLTGSRTGDRVGLALTALANGNYVVVSPFWANGSATQAGAVTWGSGTSGVRGAVSASNSLVGTLSGDQLGSGGAAALPNGNFLVSSPNFSAGTGQVLISHAALSQQTFAGFAGSDVGLDPVNLQNLLANGTAVTLQANTDLTIASPITVAGNTGGTLTLQAGRSIVFNANVTTANGNLTAIANDPGAVAAQRDAGSGNVVIASGVSLNVGTGTATLVGQAFVNSSGAAALQTSGAGRWTVWSTDPANDTRGSLTYDFKQYNAVYASTTVAQAAGNGFLYSLAPLLAASLTGSVSKVYDATTTASLSGLGYSTAGSVDGDTITLSPLPVNGRFDTPSVGTGKTVTAAGVSLVSAVNGSAKVYGYALTSSASAALGSITPARRGIAGVTPPRADLLDPAKMRTKATPGRAETDRPGASFATGLTGMNCKNPTNASGAAGVNGTSVSPCATVTP